jgi:hypothetical protein
MKNTRSSFPFIALAILIISSCASQPGGDPATSTLAYLQALSRQEKTVVVNSVCKEWEDQAALEVDALLSVGSSLKDVSCEVVGEEGEKKLVRCSGELELTYTDEVRFIDLSLRTYSMVWEDGKWRVCSYR